MRNITAIFIGAIVGVAAIIVIEGTERRTAANTVANLASVRAELGLDPADNPILETYHSECINLWTLHDQSYALGDKHFTDNLWSAVAAVCGDF